MNGLVSEIIKARYHPTTSLLEAEVGKNPSYVWRSLMEAMEVVKAGVGRKIGNGKNTKVWHIPWLPDVEAGYLKTLMPAHLKDITMNSLMDDIRRSWVIELTDDVFNSRDAELIKRVPIPMTDKRDTWFWVLVDKGTFTFKSSYR